MAQVIRMPMLGNTMEVGIVLEWTKSEGESVAEGDTLTVVESEKATSDVPASQDGILARIDVEEGEEVPPGTVLGFVLGPDETLSEVDVEPRAAGVVAQEEVGDEGTDSASEGPEPSDSGPVGADTCAGVATGDTGGAQGGRDVLAAPGARRLASEMGVDLTGVDGTGPNGEVLIADVESYNMGTNPVSAGLGGRGRTFASPSTRHLARRLGVSIDDIGGSGINGRVTATDVRAAATGPSDPIRTQTTDGPDVTVTQEQELTGIRATIADRMTVAAQAPTVTLNRNVSVQRAMELAEEQSGGNASIRLTDVLLIAGARALREHPGFNAWFENQIHREIAEINVAVAVESDRGLVTPIVRDVDRRSLRDISRERRRMTTLVKEDSFTPSDLAGGTFTISNLGMFGVGSFNPMLNPPQVAILGVGRVMESSGGRYCTLSLTFDHRVADGADAARFLDTLTEGVERPEMLLTDGEWSVRPRTVRKSVNDPEDNEARMTSLEADVAESLRARSIDVAEQRGWHIPRIKWSIELTDGPAVVVEIPADADCSEATVKRLVYAACRESEYVDIVAGLRNPTVKLERGESKSEP